MDKHLNFMGKAFWTALEGTCKRLKVGAVLVDGDNILGSGANTSLPGTSSCGEDDCRMYNGSCVRTIHAEVNAIKDATDRGYNVSGSTLYCTDQPCADCLKYITLYGVEKVYYGRPYRHKYDVDTNIELIHLEGWEKVDTPIKN